ncbi:hypothetical protein [Acaryochloris sp. IP29b_bin.137]|uniref:hypothetical protein n=1 Tax=Acaryochloris sp. IP29b_bin.137 TaxID=2969217 RepID=UPI002607B9CC|nr:hypothetical protein [Acaryochloris sp. IP29b_bin.137]
MNKKGKILFGLTLAIVVLGGMTLLDKKEKPKAQPKAKQPKVQLVEDKEPKHPTEKCLWSRGVFVDEILKVKQYSLIAYKYDFSKPEPTPDIRLPKGMKIDLESETGHDRDAGPVYPNLDVAVMVLDPFEGCKPTIRSMRIEPLPKSFDPKVRLVMKKAYWATMFKAAEDLNVTAQSWLDGITRYVGPGMTELKDDDIKAITQLGYKLPKWYDLKLTPEQRFELQLKETSK